MVTAPSGESKKSGNGIGKYNIAASSRYTALAPRESILLHPVHSTVQCTDTHNTFCCQNFKKKVDSLKRSPGQTDRQINYYRVLYILYI